MRIFYKLLILVFCWSSVSCNYNKSKNNSITIFHAGSLSVPIDELIKAYRAEYPDIKFFAESSGSLAAARKITDLKKPCDILAVADYLIIDNLIIPDFADNNIPFSSNEMIIAFNPSSVYAKEITTDNWTEILTKENVKIGRSDPNMDPCGYRTVFVFQLAEQYYNESGLTDKLMTKKQTVIRPKEVDLLALLETSNIDYLFIYKSVAIQHKLNYISLPDEMNLSNPDMEHIYQTAKTTVIGATQGETVDMQGSTILYSFCIPYSANNPERARHFAEFLLHPDKGGRILSEQGMKPIINGKSKQVLKQEMY